jgi:hypothetical protein
MGRHQGARSEPSASTPGVHEQANSATPQALAKARPEPVAPLGHELCDCEPIKVTLKAYDAVNLKGSDLARHAGLEVTQKSCGTLPGAGELAGVVVLSGAQGGIQTGGRSWPTLERIRAWKLNSVRCSDGDTLRLSATRDAMMTLWPYMVCAAVQSGAA